MSRLEKIALLAASSSQPGNENDMIIELDGQFRPVEALWEGNVITFKVGTPRKKLYGEGPSAEQIQKKYGVGPFVETGGKWDSDTLWIVDTALASLSPEELKGVAGLPFHIMEKDPSNKAVRGRSLAMYRQDAKATQIELYRLAIEMDKRKFTGTIDNPTPSSVSMLVHELGHAIAKKTLRDAVANYAPEKAALDELTKRAQEAQKAYNAKRQEYAKSKDPALGKELQAETEAMKKLQEELNAKGKIIAALGGIQARGGAAPSPVEKALIAKLPQNKAPTAYGRTLPGEAFAECFRLAKMDKAALDRAAPGISAFFASPEYAAAIAELLK